MRFNLLVGVVYGALLMIVAILAAGAGHGTFVPMAISSAPAGLLGDIAAFGGAPVVWAAVGWLRQRNVPRSAMVLLLFAHYASGIWLIRSEPFGSADRMAAAMQQIPEVVLAWTAVYLAGQILLWSSLLRETASQDRR